ncbi:type VI secretion system Vgr family protein, partial [Paraherbaspirillum soli]
FFSRLCEEWGISYFFEHSDGAHRLILADANAAFRPSASSTYHVLKFRPDGNRIAEETIRSFSPAHRLTAGTYTSRDYDYMRPKADLTVRRSEPRPTAQNNQEMYEWRVDANYTQPQAGSQQTTNHPRAEGEFIALMRMQAMSSQGRRAHGSGPLRGMVPGCTFTLQQHPHAAANIEYIIVSTRLTIEDVAQATQSPGDPDAQQYRVDAEFEVHPAREQEFRPARNSPKPKIAGVVTAKVVGPEGQNLWVDALGRIKVQFAWDRLGHNDQNSSCWIRSAEMWAGNQLGSLHLPRIGQEVVIGFDGGDPDLPLCIGRVSNQMNQPPWQLPSQQALSGLRSRELMPGGGNSAAGRSNHLILDDTEQQIQAQLKSDHQHSQLSLGHITRIDGNAGRKDARGNGWELRSDGHGVARAAHGMLLTTEGRSQAHGHITDLGETAQRLTQAREQHASLADLAQQHQAQERSVDQSEVAQAIQAQNAAIQGAGGSSEAGRFPELAAPHLVLASPAGIETTTAQSTHIASGEHIALTSGKQLSLSVGKSLLASIAEKWSVFVHKLGIKLVAASGKVQIQAQSDDIELIAQKVVEIISTGDWIHLRAKQGIRLQGGHSELVIGGAEDGLVGRTPGAFHVWSAGPQTFGPMS